MIKMNMKKSLMVIIVIGFLFCLFGCKDVAITSITLNTEFNSVECGKTITITAVILPEDATNKELEWTSTNDSIATVKDGIVTGVTKGTVTIKAHSTVEDIEGNISIDVVEAKIPVTNVNIALEKATLDLNKELTINAVVSPENASNKNLSWKTSDAAIATVSSTGVVKGISVGKATITVTTEENDKLTDSIEIEVVEPIILCESITINNKVDSMTIGDEQDLTYVIAPANTTNKEVVWTSSNPEIASIKNGKVEALKDGETTITVSCGDKKDSFKLVVDYIKVTSIDITNKEYNEINVDDVITYLPVINPDSATYKDLVWESSDESVATVLDGVVTGISKGTVTITCKSLKDPDIQVSIDLTVVKELIRVHELKPILCGILESYQTAKKAHIEIDLVSKEQTLKATYKSVLDDNNDIINLMYVMTGSTESSCYVLDGKAYMKINETTGQYELSSGELSDLSNEYNISNILSELTKFYSEDEFYDALVYTSETENKVTYTLDINNYKGKVINVVGQDTINFVFTRDETGTIVEIIYVQGNIIQSAMIKYLTFDGKIEYPEEIYSYPEM